jgi:glutaredoxin
MDRELVMYGRRYSCIDQSRAIELLARWKIPYRFIDISSDHSAAQRLQSWVGHLSVPTLVISRPGEELPMEEPAALDRSRRTRGQNRGTLITEPNEEQLENFLRQNSLL